ncbi:hypothetical protein PTSG_10398 [Salpingoeca rosetta]|uniref:Uncharacterized protein n=1 Tax=Salpingoeca rosetta (strain ATCC 50818 / BSB-021) TaxID=946362 RepID=F2UR69_SALR5|nr:uncharacterized protein PTSG_10398 [Salpingoeca rosetta]EGD80124.1 hypothetical protein PTSG_10398 [Salpingoeca rosetta]|eukprot:XP_004988449.1 hypothetical protein PTSG_10398 [Salpingoeca rosetta]
MASNVLPFEAQAAVKQTAALERTADAITDTKAELVALDHRRQQTREALREIRQGNGQPLNQGFDLKPMAKQDLHSIAPR